MNNYEAVITELAGVSVVIGNKVWDLDGMTYVDLYTLFISLTDEEASELIKQLQVKIGMEETSKLTATILLMDSQFVEEEDESEEVASKQPTTTVKGNTQTLPPIKMVDMNNFYSFQPNSVIDGIDERCEEFGAIMGYFNSGYSGDQIFALLENEKQREHELKVAQLRHEREMEILKLKIEHEKEVAKIQAESLKHQLSIKQLLGE